MRRYWQNQEKVHRNMPACNLLLSGAIHFSGCMATQTIRMLKLFGLQCISPGTFFHHQRLYTIPTIMQAWRNEQRGIIRELKETGGGLILSGDCRSDSPGHCAKYGSYSLIEDRINKVLDVQLVQSSEVPSSSWCELEGLKRSMQFLMDQDMQVSALITDRNRQVAKWVREEMCSEGTRHFFDVWHIGKSIQKALDAAAKERNCEDLKLWRPAIINHLYWTAASTHTGDPDEMEAKLQSMINHAQDIHEHSTPAFTSCAHPPLEGEARDREWLEPGCVELLALTSGTVSHEALLASGGGERLSGGSGSQAGLVSQSASLLRLQQKPLSNREKAARHRARINANPISRARYLAKRRESYEQRKREGKITHSPIAKLSMTRQQELRQNWRRYKKIQREKIRTITPQSCGHIEVNSQCQQESVINSASSETDCSSATHESPVSSWMKQEPKNEIIEWENMNFEVHTDAEQDSTLSNAISTTTPVESLLTSEMLTITKQHCLLECNKVKIEALEKQVQDLQEDRMFLRTQIENLTSVLSAYVRDGVHKNQET
nr:uncharacterized protein LOC129426346 isoform X2 [Misgurnus anguillicaudatus]